LARFDIARLFCRGDMKIDVSLVATLVVLGLFALAPQLWSWFRRRRSLQPPSPDRPRHWATALLFNLGLVSLALAAADVGLTSWQTDARSKEDDSGAVAMDLFSPDTEAPDFSLPSLEDGRSVSLSEFRGNKPLVLIFGSFS
jgi:hypothetical protein